MKNKKQNKKKPKKYMKVLSNVFLMNSPHWLVIWYAPNFTETEKIFWYHFVRRTKSHMDVSKISSRNGRLSNIYLEAV